MTHKLEPRSCSYGSPGTLKPRSATSEATAVRIPCTTTKERPPLIATRESSCIAVKIQHSSAQFRCSVMSDSLWPPGLQHTRPPCPSPAPGVYSNSYPLSQWCHPTISSSVIPFSSCLQSFPASGSFQLSQFFASGGQSIGVSGSTSAQS